jgi:hypothetical protein
VRFFEERGSVITNDFKVFDGFAFFLGALFTTSKSPFLARAIRAMTVDNFGGGCFAMMPPQ